VKNAIFVGAPIALVYLSLVYLSSYLLLVGPAPNPAGGSGSMMEGPWPSIPGYRLPAARRIGAVYEPMVFVDRKLRPRHWASFDGLTNDPYTWFTNRACARY
jgi:hypothetical protein